MSLQGFNPGRRDKRVSLFSSVETDDGEGGFDVTWSLSGVVWASWTPQPGREVQALDQKLGIGVGTFRIPYRTGITSKFRLVWGTTAYDLVAPPVVIGRNYLDLICQTLDPSNLTDGLPTMQIGSVDLDPDDESKAIVIPYAFASTPAGRYVTLVAPAGQPSFSFAERAGSPSPTGWTVDLGAGVPAAGYKLNWIATQ